MTNEQAKSELMQLYGSLSEEKKQALDVLMAQADGEKNCLNCKHQDFICEVKGCKDYKKWEQADGDLISIKDVNSVLHNHMFDNAHRPSIYAELNRISKELDGLTVAIPPDHDGCKDCRYQDKGEDELPCRECQQNYKDKWEAKANKTGHWIEEDMFDGDVAYRCSECDELFWLEDGTPKDNGYDFCPKCGKRLVEPQERSEPDAGV